MARVVDEIIKPNQIYNDGHRFKNHLFFIPFQLDLRVDFEFFDADVYCCCSCVWYFCGESHGGFPGNVLI